MTTSPDAAAVPGGDVGRHRVPAPLLMLGASLLFATMGACVKFASAQYAAGEIVLYRSLVGIGVTAISARAAGIALRTPVPGMHLWRSLSGVTALCLWFYSIGGLPLATAMTLNAMSSVWMAVFMLGGALIFGAPNRIDGRLVAAVLAGFAGVALVLQPTMAAEQLWYGLCGLLSGMLAALAYLQVKALGRAGEPELRVVFYFSLGGIVAGLAMAPFTGGLHAHSAGGVGLLLAIGVLATAAQLMMTRAYAIGRTLGNAALQYLGIAFSSLLGLWLFGDVLTWPAVAGMLLIVGAGLASTVVSLRGKTEPVHPTDP